MFSRWIITTMLAVGLWVTGSAAQDIQPVPAFAGTSAMDWLVKQCDLGPRTPGSEGNTRLREMILALAETSGLSASAMCFESRNPLTEETVNLCNIIVSAGPPGGNRLWLGAHYDTRPVCDKDPDPAKRHLPLTGANDGASGVAVLMHLMEIFAQNPPARGVDLLFFDGEDSGSAGQPLEFCLGSQHLAQTWGDFGHPLATGTPEGLIVLDMVGDRDLSIPQEQYSLRYNPELLGDLFARAFDLGLTAFVVAPGPPVYDDHVPFIQAGIPAVDLIDFDYPQWHTTGDVPAACSASSLEQVGTLMVDAIYNP